ncbi:nucleoside recognition protein, partial [Bifidobacterium pseudocatenulatum]|nr:nucleoside recognition protein [Bifidobacterium pseudocatenulatum]
MINLIWAAMILVGIITALLTGHMEDVNAGIIDAGSDAVSLCITMLG